MILYYVGFGPVENSLRLCTVIDSRYWQLEANFNAQAASPPYCTRNIHLYNIDMSNIKQYNQWILWGDLDQPELILKLLK